MKKRVLITVPNLDSTASPWREAMGLAKRLPADRFELTVCSLRPDGVAESTPVLEQLGVNCFTARFRTRGRRPGDLLRVIRDSGLIRRKGPFDVQHSMDFTTSPLEALLVRRHARRFIFSQRNMNRDGHVRLLRMKSRMASKVICVSDAVRQFMAGICAPAKLLTVHPGIEADQITWRAPQVRPAGELRLLVVGHLVPLKRIEDAISTVALLAREFPRLCLQIAGRPTVPEYRHELERRVREAGLGDRIAFLGSRKDVLELMRDSDVLLHTAETEAFGMALLEAMAVGLPVVAADIEGPREIIEHRQSGFLVPPGDVRLYADAVRSLVKDPELGQRLSANARKRVETRFTAKRMAEEIAQVYTSL